VRVSAYEVYRFPAVSEVGGYETIATVCSRDCAHAMCDDLSAETGLPFDYDCCVLDLEDVTCPVCHGMYPGSQV
jgi:hypothetical protein